MASMPFSLSLVVSCPDHGTGPFFFCAASFTIYLPCGLSIHFLSHGASDQLHGTSVSLSNNSSLWTASSYLTTWIPLLSRILGISCQWTMLCINRCPGLFVCQPNKYLSLEDLTLGQCHPTPCFSLPAQESSLIQSHREGPRHLNLIFARPSHTPGWAPSWLIASITKKALASLPCYSNNLQTTIPRLSLLVTSILEDISSPIDFHAVADQFGLIQHIAGLIQRCGCWLDIILTCEDCVPTNICSHLPTVSDDNGIIAVLILHVLNKLARQVRGQQNLDRDAFTSALEIHTSWMTFQLSTSSQLTKQPRSASKAVLPILCATVKFQ